MMAEPAVEVDDAEEELGEVQVAEYLMLLLAVDTFAGYVEETTDSPANDDQTRRGIRLLRLADSQNGDSLRDYFLGKLTREESQRAVKRSFNIRVTNAEQAGRRAMTLKTALNRGGAATLKAVFDEARPRTAVKTSIAASMLDDPAAALDRYSALPIRNLRIKNWIREAREVVGAGASVHNPVESAAAAVLDHVQTLKNQKVAEEGTTGADAVHTLQDARAGTLSRVQTEATEAARAAIEVSQELDAPPTRSEVIGLATAVAAAAVADTTSSTNVPESLRRLDPEQQAAALTDGKVLVPAGAGSGKSTTAVARVKYLVDERKVPPNKILVSSFNKKAADELKTKIGKAVGGERAKDMQVGTLHGLFKGAISKYGTPEEQGMFRGKMSILSGSAIGSAVNRLWRKCFAVEGPDGELEDADAPNAKEMMMAKTKWSGNGITPAMAKARARNDAERKAAQWYEMYEGLKGAIPGWKPACEDRAEATREYDNFLKKNRLVRGKNDREYYARIGDFDDMVTVFRDILKRSPEVRQRAQKAFDHVIIDECQDLNEVQNEVLEMMTEHVTDGADGKSFWMVGDDKQAIYAFRGARPDIFTKRAEDPSWKVRVIRTNYRCPPEVVGAANKLIAHNNDQIPMEANAAPGRPTGEASITANVYPDEAQTAIAVAAEIRKTWDDKTGEISDNAILARTNKELNAYETALLMRNVPYARKGASSFLTSPETKAFLGYVTLATDADCEKTQQALRDILNKPNRFFVAPDQVDRAVDLALNNYGRNMGVAKKSIDPMQALRDHDFQADLVFVLTGARTGFKANKAFTQLEALIGALDGLSALTQSDSATTKDMFDAVLEMPGTKFKVNPITGRIEGERTMTFRQDLSASIKDYGDEDEEAQDAERPDEMNLGNISFLYELAKPNPDDPGDVEISPETPKGFWAKMGRLNDKAKELRIDLTAWEKDQEKLPPEDRKPAPGVYLGTVHSVKGAQWPNVYVQMTKGRFPMEPRKKDDDEDSESPERLAEKAAELESERRLAYVALTRPSKNLRVVAPGQYNGKPAGMSRFLSEAGLTIGENVTSTGLPKTAATFVEDVFGFAVGGEF